MRDQLQTNATLIKKLPLHDLHEKAFAKFGTFAGWQMPLTYPLGVMKEHLHTREKAGLFDISHMKLIEAIGDQVIDFLNYALPIDAENLPLFHSHYTYLLDQNAKILDDLIVTRLDEKRFILAVNAGNAENDYSEFEKRASSFAAKIKFLDRVFLALQGPQAIDVLQKINFPVEDLFFMQGKKIYENVFVARSGYTGEDGFEIAAPYDFALDFVQKIIKDERVEWIGLAARDSLRLEAGLCLHGNDISKNDSPIQAALLWAVPKKIRESNNFVGAQALQDEIKKGPDRRRIGLKIESKQPVRQGAKLFLENGEEVGYVTSGGFAPSFGSPIAMGYVLSQYAQIGTKLYALVRDRQIPISIYKMPFIQQRYIKG